MGKYKEWAHTPDVTVNGREYVDKELFIECALERIDQERKDASSVEQRSGLDIAKNILQNLK